MILKKINKGTKTRSRIKTKPPQNVQDIGDIQTKILYKTNKNFLLNDQQIISKKNMSYQFLFKQLKYCSVKLDDLNVLF